MFQVVLHYQIQEKLGDGAMGVVYKALDRKLNRFVALKFLPAEMADRSANLERFVQEALVLSAMNHPHIATIYDVASAGKQQFLVLEYLPGGTLKAKIEQLSSAGESLSIQQALSYARQTAEGLAHAHARGIIHRDIKTSNLMLTEEGSIKITDFGVAKLAGSRFRTVPGSLVGTIAYMSPEQAQGLEADARSDIFSFGIVLFELVTGRVPFEAETDAGLLTKIASAQLPELHGKWDDVPVELRRIVERALQKDPQQRYQRMEELLRDLETAQDPGSTQTVLRVQTKRDVLPNQKTRLALGGTAAAIVLIAGAVMLAPYVKDRLATVPRVPQPRQLVVLPFRNVSGDPTDRALCDGLMEILSNKLTQLQQPQGSLSVVSSSEVLKERVTGAKEARDAFGATLILDGSVQRSGDRILVTANLVDAKRQTVLAAGDVQARAEQLSSLQDSLVQKVAEMLQLQVNVETRRLLAAGLTAVPGAYEFYLQGRGYLQRFDRLEDLDSAIAVFDQALKRDPSYALAYAGKAEAYLRKYRAIKDSESIRRARESGQHALQLNEHLAPVHYAMGLIYVTGGEYEHAVNSFEKSLQIHPHPDAYRELANAYDVSDKTDAAETTYKRAIQMNPQYWAGYRDLGIFYQAHGRFEEALPLLHRVIELTPDNYRGYANLGGLYLRRGMTSNAIENFERAISMKPTWGSYYNLGTAYYLQHKYADAIEMYKKAIDLTPTEALPWAALADAYRYVPQPIDQVTNTYRRAIELTEKELRVNPRDAQTRANLASWLIVIDRKRALQEIREALSLSPKDNFVQSRAALVYEQSGKRDEALAAVKSAVELGYSIEEIQNWPPLERLRQDPRYKRMIDNRSVEMSTVPTTDK